LNKRIILYNLGRITSAASALLLVPMIVSLLYRDGCAVAFLVPAVLMLILGIACLWRKPTDKRSYIREGLVTASIMWVIFSVFGALPFVISGCIPEYIDALFETVSGFTTTGSTILTDVEVLPPSMLFWRSLTHWVGGMGVLALAIALLPNDPNPESADRAAMNLVKAESPGPTFGKLVAKLRYNVRILYGIYTVMTVVLIIILIFLDMPVFDSVLTAFGTAGTGGFSPRNSSIAYYDSAAIEMVIAVFMLLFGVNFNIYFFLLTGKLLKILKSEELRWYILIAVCACAAITLNILPMYDSIGEALRRAFFQVASILTTTGYITANYDLWPVFSQLVLVGLMLCGGCASSTAGGLKISRIIILIKNAYREIRTQLSPREVRAVRCDNETIPQNVANGVSVYFSIFIMMLLVSTLLVSLDGRDPATTFSAVLTCLNNTGPALGEIGAVGNFSEFSVFSKLVLTFDMLAGRLELYPILALISPAVWKKGY